MHSLEGNQKTKNIEEARENELENSPNVRIFKENYRSQTVSRVYTHDYK